MELRAKGGEGKTTRELVRSRTEEEEFRFHQKKRVRTVAAAVPEAEAAAPVAAAPVVAAPVVAAVVDAQVAVEDPWVMLNWLLWVT